MRLLPAWADMTKAARVRRKLTKLPTVQLYDLADGIGSGMRQALRDHQNSQAPTSLLEAEEGHIQMTCLLEELRARRP